jgi:hypothetical protein
MVAAALKQRHVEFFFEFFDSDAERGLADVTAIRRLAEMAGLVQSDDVAQFGKRHSGPVV